MARYDAISQARLRKQAGNYGAFMEGYKAARDKNPGCPHSQGSGKARLWQIGWQTRVDEEMIHGVN